MKQTFLVLASALLLTACAHDDGQPGNASDTGDALQSNVSSVNGEAAYNEHCAGCHETGMLGAPVAGDAVDWGARSRLWDAVLLDHAITGYLEMPARGGRTELPDEVVKSAAEYMLRMTFPDMQHDCNPPHCSDVQE
jgi:cytochrome c5